MIILKYYNAKLQIGLADWKTVYQFRQAEKLMTEIDQGKRPTAGGQWVPVGAAKKC